jgi:hypothetical protein
MMVFSRGIGLVIGALAFAGAAGAQESLDSGKTPAQLFASDCSICHKSPQGLAKSGKLFRVDNFLREHYTASRESAAAIAAYLQAMDNGPAAPARGGSAKKGAGKADDKTKGAEKKFGGKSSDTKPSDAKPAAATPADAKSGEGKPAESKPAETKPADTSEPNPAQSPKQD